MWDVLVDSLLDSLKLLPFLFLVYLFIEIIEDKSVSGFKSSRLLKGGGAPLLGASVGLVPQCGFSVMATKLFSSKHIGMGTLLAVYLATSDEALPIMLSNVSNLPNIILNKLLPLFAIKFTLALVVGYAVFFATKSCKAVANTPSVLVDNQQKTTPIDKNCNSSNDSDQENPSKEENIGCCGHQIGHENQHNKIKKYLLHPLVHSLKIFAYIFVINIILGTIIYYVGDAVVVDALASVGYFQPLLATAIGLVPNCAASVLLTQLFLENAISLGSAVAGLSVNAGLAFAVLFQQNKNIKQNFAIIGIAFASSAIVGTLLMVFGL